MFSLGFTLEELMFPENYQSNLLCNIETNCLIDKSDEISSMDDGQEHIIIVDDDDDDDNDDDWFTIKQINSDISSISNNTSFINDQILPLTDVFSDNCQVKSMGDLDGTINPLLSPKLSIRIIRDQNNSSSSSNKNLISKSTSSLSFCTQSSTSMTNSSIDEINVNSNDLNEISLIHHSIESSQRRRKRTVFTSTDIEHLKEAFIKNPKPNPQDIAILSEQLGHDSYVIRVWFYNKRQAAKKRIN